MKPLPVRLDLAFHLELKLPPELSAADPARLQQQLAEALGAMVLQGLPTIATKQLAKSGVEVKGSGVKLSVQTLTPEISAGLKELLPGVAPHLTDEELRVLTAFAAGLPGAAAPEELKRALRRKALSIANEFRLVPCRVHALLTSGEAGVLEAVLNLTNGSVMVEAQDRQKRLHPGQSQVGVEVPQAQVSLEGAYAGHTISGPVIEVQVTSMGTHRDALIGLWQQAEA